MGTRLETHVMIPVTIEGSSGKEKVDGGGGSREDTEEDDRKNEKRTKRYILTCVMHTRSSE